MFFFILLYNQEFQKKNLNLHKTTGLKIDPRALIYYSLRLQRFEIEQLLKYAWCVQTVQQSLYKFNAIPKSKIKNIIVINMKRKQPFLSVLNLNLLPVQSFSLGYILLLFKKKKKSLKRSLKSLYFLFYFFEKYFSIYLKKTSVFVISCYKYRYHLFIKKLIQFLNKKVIGLYLHHKKINNNYFFKKYRSIKKRIRKKLN